MVDRVTASMDSDNESPDAVKSREDHEAEMVKVAEAGTTNIKDTDKQQGIDTNLSQKPVEDEQGGDNPTRPEGIPEKFWDAEKGEVNVEALLKAQKDGEEYIAQLKSGKEPEEKPAEGETEETAESQQGAVDAAAAEFAEKGELTADTYANLAKSGISKEMVDTYIDGQKAIVAGLQDAAWSDFGGKDGYEKAVDWAAESLSEDEIKALDVQLTSTNKAIVAQGAAALKAKYEANADIDPETTLRSGGNETVTGGHFKSGAEMQTAMSDPRYQSDSAFRDEVAAKIDRAAKAGVNLFV